MMADSTNSGRRALPFPPALMPQVADYFDRLGRGVLLGPNPSEPASSLFSEPPLTGFGPTAADIVATTPRSISQLPSVSDPGQTYVRSSDGRTIQAGSVADALVRAAANRVSFNQADTLQAEIDSTFHSMSAASSKAPSWPERLRENRDIQRTRSAADAAEHPLATAGGTILGVALDPVTAILGPAGSVGTTMGRGAAMGAARGLGDAIRKEENFDEGANSVVSGALTGSALATAWRAGKVLKERYKASQ